MKYNEICPPINPTARRVILATYADMAELADAADSKSAVKSSEFDSRYQHHYADVAQQENARDLSSRQLSVRLRSSAPYRGIAKR